MVEERNKLKEIANRVKDFRHMNVITKTKVTSHLNFFNWSTLNLQFRAYLTSSRPTGFHGRSGNRINKIGW